MSRSLVKLWRLFAAITFINQIVRVPLLLSLVASLNDLEAYFIISATLIPIQFIANDILQFRSKFNRIDPFEKFGLPIFAFGSLAYVTWHYDFVIGITYLVFAITILLYGASVGHLRDVYSAERVLAIEALYNTCATVMAVTSVLNIQTGTKLGIAVILSQAGVAAMVSIVNFFLIWLKHDSVPSFGTHMQHTVDNQGGATSIVLASIMATTQIERLVISVSQPAVLAGITLAGGIAQAWRKVAMDDAIVFERLRHASGDRLFQAMRIELIRARFIFYPPLLCTLIACAFVSDIAEWTIAHSVLPSINLLLLLEFFQSISQLCQLQS
jgi:hypothetical protein